MWAKLCLHHDVHGAHDLCLTVTLLQSEAPETVEVHDKSSELPPANEAGRGHEGAKSKPDDRLGDSGSSWASAPDMGEPPALPAKAAAAGTTGMKGLRRLLLLAHTEPRASVLVGRCWEDGGAGEAQWHPRPRLDAAGRGQGGRQAQEEQEAGLEAGARARRPPGGVHCLLGHACPPGQDGVRRQQDGSSSRDHAQAGAATTACGRKMI